MVPDGVWCRDFHGKVEKKVISMKKSQCMSQRKHPLVYHCPDCGRKLKELDRKYKQDHLLLCMKCRMAESLKQLKRWKCSLCNMCLVDDKDAKIRKQRHKEFHVDESIGTTKRQRNWTFGKAEFELVEQ